MVEAAMVLPILILVILSMILVTLFYYRTLESQVIVHEKLIQKDLDSNKSFAVVHEEGAAEVDLRGAVTEHWSASLKGKHYIYHMAPLIRLGKMIDDVE